MTRFASYAEYRGEMIARSVLGLDRSDMTIRGVMLRHDGPPIAIHHGFTTGAIARAAEIMRARLNEQIDRLIFPHHFPTTTP